MWKEKSTNELTTEELYNILIQLRKINIRQVSFGGGEPLLRKDLGYLIKKAKELGFQRITVLTNGFLLKERAKELLESGLNRIGISLDGDEEIHDICRGVRGTYERCLEGLKTVTDFRKSQYPYLDVGIGMNLMRPTLDYVSSITRLCEELELSLFFNLIDDKPFLFKGIEIPPLVVKDQAKLNKVINELHYIKKQNPSLLSMNHIGLEYCKNYFKGGRKEDVSCILGFTSVYIDAHGNLYSGCWALPPLGNLRESNLREIVFTSQYNQRIKKMFRNECPGCSCGYMENLYYNIPSNLRNILWSLSMTFKRKGKDYSNLAEKYSGRLSP